LPLYASDILGLALAVIGLSLLFCWLFWCWLYCWLYCCIVPSSFNFSNSNSYTLNWI